DTSKNTAHGATQLLRDGSMLIAKLRSHFDVSKLQVDVHDKLPPPKPRLSQSMDVSPSQASPLSTRPSPQSSGLLPLSVLPFPLRSTAVASSKAGPAPSPFLFVQAPMATPIANPQIKRMLPPFQGSRRRTSK